MSYTTLDKSVYDEATDNFATHITRYYFHDLLLDVQRGVLTRHGNEVSLPKLSYNLLLALVTASPTLLSQQSLIDKVWGNIVIGDETLKQRIKLLRRSLGDNASAPIYIEAVRGRGYRLIPEVSCEKTIAKPATVMIDLSADDRFPNLSAQQLSGVWQYTAKIVFITLIVMGIILATTLYLLEENKALSQSNNAKSTLTNTLNSTKDTPQISQHIALNYYQKGLNYYKRYRALDNHIAIDFFNKALTQEPTLSLAYAGLSQAYAQQVFQFHGGKIEKQKAIDNAYQAIVYDNKSAESYKALGSAYYVSGWLAKSIDPYLKSLTLLANNTDAMSNLGFIYSEQGKLLEALKWDEQALRINSEHIVSMVHAGQTLARLEQYTLAQKWYQKAIDKQPDYLLATFHLAKLYTSQQLFSKAHRLLTNTLQRYPDHPLLLEGLAENFYLQRKPDLAYQTYQKIPLSHEGFSSIKIMQYLLQGANNQQQWQHLVTQLKKALELGSDKASYSYYLALLYAHNQQPKLAIRYLVQSVEQGLTSSYKIILQPQFDHLKTLNSFQKIITDLQHRHNVLNLKAKLTFWLED